MAKGFQKDIVANRKSKFLLLLFSRILVCTRTCITKTKEKYRRYKASKSNAVLQNADDRQRKRAANETGAQSNCARA